MKTQYFSESNGTPERLRSARLPLSPIHNQAENKTTKSPQRHPQTETSLPSTPARLAAEHKAGAQPETQGNKPQLLYNFFFLAFLGTGLGMEAELSWTLCSPGASSSSAKLRAGLC